MASYNKVILVGNLTRDPQMSYLPSQMAVVEFGLAVNRRWRGPDGQQREDTCFVDCRAYGKQAETINQYLAKGKSVLVEGRLQFDTWEGKDGTKRSKHRVVVERFQFLGAPTGARPAAAAPRTPAPEATGQEDLTEPAPPPEEGGDDIPF
jgi:single-strand DNA-binding protein